MYPCYLRFLALRFLRWSALTNFLATDTGIPTFFAKAGLCAAAAIVLACFLDLLGIVLPYNMGANIARFTGKGFGLGFPLLYHLSLRLYAA